jgi:hypothetical protein
MCRSKPSSLSSPKNAVLFSTAVVVFVMVCLPVTESLQQDRPAATLAKFVYRLQKISKTLVRTCAVLTALSVAMNGGSAAIAASHIVMMQPASQQSAQIAICKDGNPCYVASKATLPTGAIVMIIAEIGNDADGVKIKFSANGRPLYDYSGAHRHHFAYVSLSEKSKDWEAIDLYASPKGPAESPGESLVLKRRTDYVTTVKITMMPYSQSENGPDLKQ